MTKNSRLDEKEWMDLGNYSPKEYDDCLHQLDRVGRILGGDRSSFWAFDQLKTPPLSILDVGCGGGSFTIKLAQKYPQAKVVGVDIAPEAIEYAKRLLKTKNPSVKNVEFITLPTPHLDYKPKSFDVVTSTLVCHHLSDKEIVRFLKDASTIARHSLILNDLHRHPLACISFKLIAPILFPNRMVVHDGLVSIKRAFKRADWTTYFAEANIPPNKISLSWHWAFRWIAMVNTEVEHNDG